jgi:hypothetical protein
LSGTGHRLRAAGGALAAVGLAALAANAEPPAPQEPRAFDTPNDGGRSITITWSAPPGAAEGIVVRIERIGNDGVSILAGEAPLAAGVFHDAPDAEGQTGPEDGVDFMYRLTAVEAGTTGAPVGVGPAQARPQLFHRERWNVLLLLLGIVALVLTNVWRASRGARFPIRRLAPVEAIDEAVGRATEMGRPVLYVPGIENVEDIQTIASMLILERIAEKTAGYDVPLHVPVRTPFVLAVADEVVRNGCTAAGRPDAYRPDAIRFISEEQFAYCAGVNGTILREKPAANLYMGRFFAESLIFAETGFAAGSIQIAGTAEVTQLPFFIAACDYTLIGEEFFAASASLSGDPALLATLKAADWAKALLVGMLVTGAVLQSFGIAGFREWFLVR